MSRCVLTPAGGAVLQGYWVFLLTNLRTKLGQGTSWPGNELARERVGQGTSWVHGNKLAREQLGMGTSWLGTSWDLKKSGNKLAGNEMGYSHLKGSKVSKA